MSNYHLPESNDTVNARKHPLPPWLLPLGLLAATNLFAPCVGHAATARTTVRASPLPHYELKISRDEWTRLQRSARSDERRPATFTAEGKDYAIGLRYRGDWARTWPKKPLKVFFTGDKEFEGQKVLNFNSCWRDPAFVREALAYHVYAACGVPSPKARMVRLNLNGQFYGLFVEVEQPDKAFVKRLNLKGAAIYKADSPGGASDERDLGTEAGFRAHYEKESRKQEGYGDLQEFCRALARATNTVEFFHRHVELPAYINYLAATALVQNWDYFNKNHFLVRDTLGSKKWLMIPWDLDRTFGDHWSGGFDHATLPLVLGTSARPGPTGWNQMFEAFFREPALRNQLLDRLETLLRDEFTTGKLFPLLDQWERDIKAEAALDRQRWPNREVGNLREGIAELKRYIDQRRAFLLREIRNERAAKRPR
jgi:spore coat protein H